MLPFSSRTAFWVTFTWYHRESKIGYNNFLRYNVPQKSIKLKSYTFGFFFEQQVLSFFFFSLLPLLWSTHRHPSFHEFEYKSIICIHSCFTSCFSSDYIVSMLLLIRLMIRFTLFWSYVNPTDIHRVTDRTSSKQLTTVELHLSLYLPPNLIMKLLDFLSTKTTTTLQVNLSFIFQIKVFASIHLVTPLVQTQFSLGAGRDFFLLFLHNSCRDLPDGSSLGSCSGFYISSHIIMNGSQLDRSFGYSLYIPSVYSHVGSPLSYSAVQKIISTTNWHIAIQHVLFCLREGSNLFHIYLVPPLVRVFVTVLAPPLVSIQVWAHLESIQVQVSFVSAGIC